MKGFNKRKLLSETASICRKAEIDNHPLPPIDFKMFKRADGSHGFIDRASIDSGDVARAGITVIDGDRLEIGACGRAVYLGAAEATVAEIIRSLRWSQASRSAICP